MQMAWDIFKAYMRGILVSFKAHRDKTRGTERARLIEGIQEKETLNKRQVTPEINEQLSRAYETLKIIDARRIAQDIAYSNQNMFDYESKAGKQLARVIR